MEYLKLGSSNMNVSRVTLGCWAMGGGDSWANETDDAEAIRTIHAAMDAGVNLVDTAPCYAYGHSEEVVGKAIADRRDKVYVATKCGLWWQDERGTPMGLWEGKPLFNNLSPETVRIEVENSLRRLGTDHIDLYQPHWPDADPDTNPIADTMACLVALRDEGKICNIGVCNMTLDQLKEYQACGPLVSNQFRYSMISRDAETDILPHCREANLGTLTWMSIEQGLLAGKMPNDRVYKEGEFRASHDWNPWFKQENRERVNTMLNSWTDLTKKYECTLAQFAIAWTLAQDGVTHVLCGARRTQHTLENAAAVSIQIETSDLERVRAEVEALGEPA